MYGERIFPPFFSIRPSYLILTFFLRPLYFFSRSSPELKNM